MRDTIIVGAGFVGSFVAYNLAKRGIDTVVFEEDSEIGLPPHCTGLVSLRGIRRIGLLEMIHKRDLILNKIRCAEIITRSSRRKICLNNDELGVIDRVGLDKFISEMAMSHGAEFYTGHKVEAITREGHIVVRNNTLAGRVVIDAEGSSRRLLRKLLNKKILSSLPAVQIDIKTAWDKCLDVVEVYMNIPDFFSWILPIDNRNVRIGIASRRIRNLLSIVRILARRRFDKFTEINRFGGLVNVDGPYKQFVFGKVVAVGDVVGQTKPTTGGGVVVGGLSAALLAKIIEKYLSEDMPLHYYDHLWRKLFLKNINFMRCLRRLIFGINGAVIADLILKLFPQEVTFEADYDFQFDLLKRSLCAIKKRRINIS